MTGGTCVPVFLCIDVEPDRFQVGADRRSAFDGFGLIADYFMGLRPVLEETTGHRVNYSWFVRMDPQIADLYGTARYLFESEERRFDALIEAGDEVGVHVHAWRFDVSRSRYYEAIEDRGWVEHTIHSSLDEYQQATGSSCALHRFGSGYFDNAMVRLLELRGVRFDLTLEPGSRLPDQFLIDDSLIGVSDHRHVPLHPYIPSPASFAVEDEPAKDRLTLIPLTAVASSSLLRRPDRWLRGHRGPGHRPHRLWRADMDPARFWSAADRAMRRRRLTHLAFALRSHAPTDRSQWVTVRSKLEALADHPLSLSLHFTTPSEYGRSAPDDGRATVLDP